MDIDDKAMLYASDSLELETTPYESQADSASMRLPTPTAVPADQFTALASVRCIASLEFAVAVQIPHHEFANALNTLAASLPPVDQQVLASYLLKDTPIEKLSTEEMYLVSKEIASMWAANGDFSF
jgi:hypothetical protein